MNTILESKKTKIVEVKHWNLVSKSPDTKERVSKIVIYKMLHTTLEMVFESEHRILVVFRDTYSDISVDISVDVWWVTSMTIINNKSIR
jgi:hypothetical protein